MEYAFAVAEAVANAASPELGPRSTKAIFATKAKCEVGPASTKCHSGGAGVEEQHRLGAPQVNPLSCSALALELPPLPPDHCDDDRDQRLAVEARHGQLADQEGWTEIRHNVLSQTVIVGGLVASQSYEFRTVLHRPRLGDRFSGLRVSLLSKREQYCQIRPSCRRRLCELIDVAASMFS